MNDTMLLAADSGAPFEEAMRSCEAEALPGSRSVETGMKACPVCRAQAFADMETCFNCMYRFGSNPALEEKAAARAHADRMQGTGVPAEPGTEAILPDGAVASCAVRAAKADGCLLAELLVELHGFLGELLLDRGIDVKQP